MKRNRETWRCQDYEKKSFSFNHLQQSDKLINLYAGFPTVGVFNALLDYYDPGEDDENTGIGTLVPQIKILQFSTNLLRKLVDLEYFTPGKNYLFLFVDLGKASQRTTQPICMAYHKPQ